MGLVCGILWAFPIFGFSLLHIDLYIYRIHTNLPLSNCTFEGLCPNGWELYLPNMFSIALSCLCYFVMSLRQFFSPYCCHDIYIYILFCNGNVVFFFCIWIRSLTLHNTRPIPLSLSLFRENMALTEDNKHEFVDLKVCFVLPSH